LEDIIAQDEMVKERCCGVTHNQGTESASADLMRELKSVPQGRVCGDKGRNLPREYSECASPEYRVTQTRQWLDEKQGVKTEFADLNNGAVNLFHAARKWRKLRVSQSPRKPRYSHCPNRQPHRSVSLEQYRLEFRVMRPRVQPGGDEHRQHHGNRRPVEDYGEAIKGRTSSVQRRRNGERCTRTIAGPLRLRGI
jgi:hypothetical protein